MSLAVIRKHYQITLPVEVRRSLHCKEGDVIEIVVKKGSAFLKPKAVIDKDQTWFWTKEWQKGEKEADRDIKEGRVKKFKNIQDLIEDLDR